MKQFLTFNEKLLNLAIYKPLGIEVVPFQPNLNTVDNFSGIIGWGRKYGNTEASLFQKKFTLPYYALEEGFIAYDQSSNSALKGGLFPFSYSFDPIGVYYDATTPSTIETLLNNPSKMSPTHKQRVEEFLAHIQRNTISKYNPPNWKEFKLEPNKDRVLVIDQIRNDKSIDYGQASAKSFKDMLEAAFDENPHSEIVLKTHPMILRKPFSSYLIFKKLRYRKLRICATPCNPHTLIKACHTVYTVTSQMGLEALLYGKKTRVFGMPFYAGWGLTIDEQKNSRRTNQVNVAQLINEVFFNYLNYFNPYSKELCEAEDVLKLIDQRDKFIQ